MTLEIIATRKTFSFSRFVRTNLFGKNLLIRRVGLKSLFLYVHTYIRTYVHTYTRTKKFPIFKNQNLGKNIETRTSFSGKKCASKNAMLLIFLFNNIYNLLSKKQKNERSNYTIEKTPNNLYVCTYVRMYVCTYRKSRFSCL